MWQTIVQHKWVRRAFMAGLIAGLCLDANAGQVDLHEALQAVRAVGPEGAGHAEAAAAYRRVLQIAPKRAVWWMGLGLSLEALGDRARALQAYGRAQRLGTLTGEVRSFVDARVIALQ